jgi:hypothetical protein
MTMKTRLLTLLDLTEDPSVVLEFCNFFSKGDSAEVHLMHQVLGVVPALTDVRSRERILEEEKKDAYIKLQTLAKERFALSNYPYLEVTDENIVKFAKSKVSKHSLDFFVVGLKKSSLIKKLLFGTVATQLIDLAENPVLGLPLSGSSELPDYLIVSINYQNPVNLQSLQMAVDVFAERGLKEVLLVSSASDGEEFGTANSYLKTIQGSLKGPIKISAEIFISKDVLQELQHLLLVHEKSIIVVQRGSRNLLDHLFRRFLINDLVHDGQTPLLIIP